MPSRISDPTHRFVWDPQKDRSTVIHRGTGSATFMNGTAGALLWNMVSLDGFDLRQESPSFYADCVKRGWIQDDQLRGTVARVPEGPHLQRLQIELSLRCNLRCPYCYSESGPRKPKGLPKTAVVALMEEFADGGGIWLDFTGGEVCIYPHWDEVLAEAAQLGLVITVHTNGTLLTSKQIVELVSARPRAVQVSMDSHIPEVHNGIRGPGALEKTLKGIANLQEAALPVRVGVMVHGKNRDHITETVAFCRDELQVELMLDRVVAVGGELDAQVGITTKEFYELTAPILGTGTKEHRICDMPTDLMDVEPACGVAYSFIYVTASGEMALCPTMTSRESPQFKGPSILNYGLQEAWQNHEYFTQHRYANCENTGHCPAATQCGGGCRSNAYTEGGRIDSPDLAACNLHKNDSTEYVDFAALYAKGTYSLESL